MASQTKSDGGARQRREPAQARRSRRGRSQRMSILLRWCFAAVVVGVGVLYYQPLTTYVAKRNAVQERAAQVRALEAENARLRQRLERSSTLAALSREARRGGLIRPGERLFVVKGIEAWKAVQRTIPADE